MARMRILGLCFDRVRARPRQPRAPAILGLLVAVLALSLALAPAARAASLIRDAEIEGIIRSYAAPLLQDAGIPPDSVTIRLLNDPTINAFVTTGKRMFIHTGLILRAKRVDELVGVIAHEIGHIAGGHLIRLGAQREKFGTTALLGTLLGAAAGALVGRPDLGIALGAGIQGSALRGYLSHTRTEESSADAFALKALEREGLPATGMRDFMRELQGQEALSSVSQDPYLRTHPLTGERLSAIEAHVAQSKATEAGIPQAWRESHARMRAKLIAFLRPPSETLTRYQGQTDTAADYARAIAYYRAVEMDKALPLMDQLIAREPQNPFFQELRGQMLFESGRVAEALPYYNRAVSLAPNEPLLRVALGHAQVESGDPAKVSAAIDNLRTALSQDSDNALGWRLLAQAYGQTDQPAMADYAMAETALRSGDYDRALFHVGRAETQVPRGSPTWLRLQDIDSDARRQRSDADR